MIGRMAPAWLCLLLAGCAAAPPAPTATPRLAPAPTAVAPQRVAVPDLRGLKPAAAADLLAGVGMRLGAARPSCATIGAEPARQPVLADTILCQSLAPGSFARADTAIDYVISAGDR